MKTIKKLSILFFAVFINTATIAFDTTQLNQRMNNFLHKMHLYNKCIKGKCSQKERDEISKTVLEDSAKLVLILLGTGMVAGILAYNWPRPIKKSVQSVPLQKPLQEQKAIPTKETKNEPKKITPHPSSEQSKKIQESSQEIKSPAPKTISLEQLKSMLLPTEVINKIKELLNNEMQNKSLFYELKWAINGQKKKMQSSTTEPPQKDNPYIAHYGIEFNAHNWFDFAIYYKTREEAESFLKQISQLIEKFSKENKLPNVDALEPNEGILGPSLETKSIALVSDQEAHSLIERAKKYPSFQGYQWSIKKDGIVHGTQPFKGIFLNAHGTIWSDENNSFTIKVFFNDRDDAEKFADTLQNFFDSITASGKGKIKSMTGF